MRNKTSFYFVFMAGTFLAWSLTPVGCVDYSGDGSLDSDTDSDGDSDSDSDTDTDSDGDSDTTPIDDMCAEYPESDDNFATGSVITNYTFIDRTNTSFEVCELSEENDLLLIIITRSL